MHITLVGVIAMLRITAVDEPGRITLKLEGKLRGAWVKELERVWHLIRTRPERKPAQVDLSAASSVDERGKSVLTVMCRDGVELTATGPMMNAIVDEIHRAASRSRELVPNAGAMRQ
jgi:hypothetical protein